MSATEVFIKGLQAATDNDLFPEKFWESYPEKSTHTFQDALDKYAEYYQALNSTQQEAISEIFRNQIKNLGSEDLSGEEVKSIQALVEKILDDAKIPALSMSWCQTNTTKAFAFGVTDTSNPKPVHNATLFQASSLSKPVSAAMVLDLMEQNNWKSNTLLADLSDYGPPELKSDPRYRELTIGMVLGQCSGLPNVVASEDEKKFMVTPGLQFDYSGLAFDFLKEVIEKKMQKSWETLAQEFFAKVGMQSSTFKQLPASQLHGKRDVAHGHKANGTPGQLTFPLDSTDPAGSLLTTANDFMIFLQYCYNNKFIKSTLLTGAYELNKDFKDARDAARQIQWGLGMGIYTDKEKTIAFHWGNNTGWNSFCAINTKTGDAVACFVNSDNRIVIQQLAESVVGDMAPLFHWLSLCNFKAEKAPSTSNSITALFPLVSALTENVDLKRSLPAIQSLVVDESIINETMEKTDISGISIALVSDDGAIITKEFGVSDKESKNNVTQDTLFGAASLSKVVFAYLVLKLIQDQQLSLDENLNKTLSFGDFCNQVGLQCDSSIKDMALDIHSILSHTTGLDDSKDGVIQKTKSGNYWYSGIPLWYLQKVIENKTGKSLEELAKKYVFSPDACDMKHSTFYREYELAPILGPLKPAHQAQTLYIKTDDKEGVSYEVIGLDGQLKHNTIPWNELPKDFPRNVTDIIRTKETSLPALLRWTCAVNHTTKESALSANSLFTTAEDYAKFVKKWMNEEDELLKSAFTQVVSMKKDDWANAVGVSKNDLKRVAWGLGWGLELDEKGQVKKAYHTGDMNNWRAWVAIDFDKKEAIVYFANSPNGHVLADQIISPHVTLPHAFNYFSKKYGFALRYEPHWKNKEKARFDLIIQGAFTYAAPKISQLQSSFFKTAVMKQMQAENRLMPVSVSWWDQELIEKREMLEAFWWERIIKLNQKSIDEFKKHIINTHFPKSSIWDEKIEKLFSDAVARKIDFDQFFDELKYLPMIHVRGMANFEKIPLPHAGETIEPKPEIETSDLINIKRYMVERGMTGSVSFGFADQGIITPDYSDGSKCSYAMHSVGKVFTGMLTLVMIRDGVLTEKELNEPLGKDFIESLALPESLKKHLSENQVTLHQLMTHKAGLGDYLGDYGKAISQGKIPEMNKAEDFLQFAETSTSQVGKEKYSNLGILLVGLAVKHAYEKKHGACEYNELLSRYIIDEVDMPSFSSKKPEKNAKYNPEDSIAPHIAGSPAGGYWVTAEDLAKFGQWIYKSCNDDPNLLVLIKKYGQEFYNADYNMISHGGAISSSSAFLSVSLNTGAVIATLSDQPDMAFELNSMMQTHVFAKRPEVVEEEIEISYKKAF